MDKDTELLSEQTQKRLSVLLRHVNGVRDNCYRLGTYLIDNGEPNFGKDLIANGLVHDASKFSGIEWEYLHSDVKKNNETAFRHAALHHIHTNFHHPEFWGSIQEMPRIYLAEHTCDILARSNEFGDDVRDWIKEKAAAKYKYPINGKIHKQILEFLNILTEPAFK
jgi:cation diffusion facilitator CzcD-associated flavoprotein CzcO